MPSSPARRSAARPMRRSISVAIARHVGVELAIDDWETFGHDVPLLVNMQPAGEYLGEDYYRAGGLPAVMHELLRAGRSTAKRSRINGKTIGENVATRHRGRRRVIRPYGKPLKPQRGLYGAARQSVRFRDHENVA